MNVGTFSGYVGRDAELKSVGDGKVLNFSLGVTVGFGEQKETLWVSCGMWGARAEKLAQYVMKGTSLTVSGDVTVRAYSAKDGTPKAEMVCNVQRLTLQGVSKGGDVKSPPQEEPKKAQDFDSEIPF